MKIRAINRYAAIYECLAVFFAFCWFVHFAACVKMNICDRHFTVMTEQTMKAMTLIDWVTAHSWLALAYILLVVASVAFLQIRGRPQWTCWIAAAAYCIPCFVYWLPCAYIAGKLIGPQPW